MDDAPKTLRNARYTIVRLLGEGGQASTFEAVDARRGGARVAVKRFRVRGAKSWKEVEFAEREARVLASLSHPSLPRYIEHFEENGDLYLVTDKIEGQSLAEIRKGGGSLGEEEVVRLLRHASVALEYLHGRAPPVIHRDIKPSNVIRRPDGSFSLIDFGAVRDKLRPEGGSTVVGTFGYMAPEQFQGRALPSSDVYALGATALTMLTGIEPEDLPHRGLAVDVAKALQGRSTSPALTRALTAMLELDPDRRPAQIGALLADIDRAPFWTRHEPGHAGVASGAGAPRSGSGKKPLPPLRADGEAIAAEVVRNAIDRSRRERRRDEQERDARRAEQERARDARRAEQGRRRDQQRDLRDQRRDGPAPGFGGMPKVLVLFLILSLSLAQIAVLVALRVAVPALLALLSLVFGPKLRQMGRQVSRSGKMAGRSIARAKDVVVGRAPGDPRLRVEEVGDAPVRAPPPVDDEERQAEEELAAEEEARQERRRRR